MLAAIAVLVGVVAAGYIATRGPRDRRSPGPGALRLAFRWLAPGAAVGAAILFVAFTGSIPADHGAVPLFGFPALAALVAAVIALYAGWRAPARPRGRGDRSTPVRARPRRGASRPRA